MHGQDDMTNNKEESSPRRHLAHVPAYQDAPIVFFTVTTCGRRGVLNNPIAHEILRGIWDRSAERDGWFVGDYLLMPNQWTFKGRIHELRF